MKEKRYIVVVIVVNFKETLYVINFIELQVLRDKIQEQENFFGWSIHQIKHNSIYTTVIIFTHAGPKIQ